MNAQVITACPGERLVVIPEAGHEASLQMAEKAADALAVNAFQRSLATSAEDLVPAAIADRILYGETRIRVWREHRGILPSVLAERATSSCYAPPQTRRA